MHVNIANYANTLVKAVAFSVATLGVTSTAGAQHRNIEVRPFAGALIATGANRELFTDAFLTGLAAGYRVREHVTMVGSVGWAASKVKGALPNGFTKHNLDIYSYDVGVDLSTAYGDPRAWMLAPHIGAGMGGRTYNLREDRTDARTDFAAYGALGAELSRGRVGLRLTVRDYVTAMEQYAAGDAGTMARTDLAVLAALNLRF